MEKDVILQVKGKVINFERLFIKIIDVDSVIALEAHLVCQSARSMSAPVFLWTTYTSQFLKCFHETSRMHSRVLTQK